MKCEDSLYYHFTLAIPTCSLLRAWDQHMKGIVDALKSWRCSQFSNKYPKQESPRCAEELWLPGSYPATPLCIPVVKFGWIYKLEFAVLPSIHPSCCSLGSGLSTARNQIPHSRLHPAAREAGSALLCLVNVPNFGSNPFLLGLHLARRGGGSLAGMSRRFPLGKSLFLWGFSVLSLGSCLWLLPVGTGVGKVTGIGDILLNQELN